MWEQLDPKGTGLLPYSLALHHLHHFLKCFNNHHRYLAFLTSAKSQLYQRKLELFKELQLPIRTVMIDEKEGNKT